MGAFSTGPDGPSPQVLGYGTPWSSGMSPTDRYCPLCGRPLGKRRPVFLYGFPVCRRCRNGFANRRQGAFLIDFLLWELVGYGIMGGFWFVYAAAPGPAGSGQAGLDTLGALLGWGLFFLFPFRDAFRGFSPGKWLCGVQVVDRLTREPISPAQSYKRNLPMLVPCVGILVAVLQMMNGPCWGDGWANSVVIWTKYAHKLPFDPRGTYCLACGYNLIGNVSGVCPECGTPLPVAQPVRPQAR
jgi:uncharacterized RDD family membrane protein YckC